MMHENHNDTSNIRSIPIVLDIMSANGADDDEANKTNEPDTPPDGSKYSQSHQRRSRSSTRQPKSSVTTTTDRERRTSSSRSRSRDATTTRSASRSRRIRSRSRSSSRLPDGTMSSTTINSCNQRSIDRSGSSRSNMTYDENVINKDNGSILTNPPRRGTRSDRSKSPSTLRKSRSKSRTRRTRSSSRDRSKNKDEDKDINNSDNNNGVGAAILDVSDHGTITLTISDGSQSALRIMKAAGARLPETSGHTQISMGSLTVEDQDVPPHDKKAVRKKRSSSKSRQKRRSSSSSSTERLKLSMPSITATEEDDQGTTTTTAHKNVAANNSDMDALYKSKGRLAPNVILPTDFHDSVMSFDSVPDWGSDKDERKNDVVSSLTSPKQQQQPLMISPRKTPRRTLSIPTIMEEEPGNDSDNSGDDDDFLPKRQIKPLRKIQSITPTTTPANASYSTATVAATSLSPDNTKRRITIQKLLPSFGKPRSFKL
jgi:hypothetical protein